MATMPPAVEYKGKVSVIDKTFQPMTHADAVEYVEMERLKISEHGAGKSRGYREIFPGSNDLFILTLGGTNRDGSDGCNDMTDAILEGARNIRTTEPSIVFRYSKKNRVETLRKVFNCVRDGLGYPSMKLPSITAMTGPTPTCNWVRKPEMPKTSRPMTICWRPSANSTVT